MNEPTHQPTVREVLANLFFDCWRTGKFAFLIAGVIGGVMRERHVYHKDIPGFRYQEGLLFQGCYEHKTRAAIGQCLDEAYESAWEAGAWD